MKEFLLTKYYMDCVTDSGQVVLAYASHVSWGKLAIMHSSCLLHGPASSSSKTTFFKGTMPERDGGGLWRWQCPALKAEGTWQGLHPPPDEQLLYQAADGKRVAWHCLCPFARTDIRVGNDTFRGNGYLECLTMSLEPWLLPVDTLHWGRFHSSGGEALTWICWEGSHPLVVVLHGNIPVPAGLDGPLPRNGDAYPFHGYALAADRSAILRQGDISTTAVKHLPRAIKSLFPERILRINETKWAGHAVLDRNGERTDGFAIHEIVHF